MRAAVIHCENPFAPDRGRRTFPVAESVTVRGWLDARGIDEFDRPTICLFNGAALLRADWARTQLRDGDLCVFVALPHGGGGGGKNPLRIVLSIAIMVVAVWTGQVYGASFAASMGATSATAASVGTAVVTSAVMIAGGALLSAVIPAGSSASAGSSSEAYPSASPTYSLTAQGNQARLGQAIPCQYGRHLASPDFAAVPYQEYADNNQFLFSLFCLGQGHYEIEQIRIDDTPIASFQEVEIEVVEPGETVTLFDPQVVTALEVAGQEAVAPNELAAGEDGWLGPFVISDAGDTVTSIGIDVGMQRGLYYANNSGGLDPKTIAWEVQAQEIDDDGEAIGDWIVLGAESVTDATNTALYRSYKYAVPSGRYQGRFRRTDNKDTSSRAGHELRWIQARGYLNAAQDWPNVTMLAVKMRATDNLSNRTSRAVKILSTRKLRKWSASEGWSGWSATRSIVWAVADMFRARYGGRVEDSRLSLVDWAALDAILEARGDHFDYVFDTQTTVWDAAAEAAQCGRSVPVLQGGFIRLFRDAPEDVPSGMITARNIVKNSLSIKYVMPSDTTADAVIVEYYSSKTWKLAEVSARVRDESYTAWLAESGLTDTEAARAEWADLAENPIRISMPGITEKAQALREADHRAAQNRYRRIFPTLRTEADGMIPTYGDLLTVSYPMLRWGLSGEVIAWTADPPVTDEGGVKTWSNAVLRLTEPPVWAEGVDHYIALRDRAGRPIGPFLALPGDTADSVRLGEPLTIAPYVGAAAERTHYSFGPGADYARQVRVIGIRPRRAGHEVEISAVVDDARVYVN